MWLSLGLRSTCECNILATEAVCCFPQRNTAWSRTTKTDRRQRGQSSQRKVLSRVCACNRRGPKAPVQPQRLPARMNCSQSFAPETRPTVCALLAGEKNRCKTSFWGSQKLKVSPEKWSIIRCLSCVLNRELKRVHRRQLLCPLGF